MTDETQTQVVEPSETSPEGAEQSDVFSREYVESLRKEAAEWRKKTRTLEAERKAQETQALEEQGRWKEIASEREQELQKLAEVKEQYDAMVEGVEASNKTRVERIPEAMRSLVPNLPPLELARWLDASEAVLSRPGAVSVGAESGNGDRPTGSVTLTEAQRAAARRMGVSEEAYLAQLKKR